MAEVRIFTDEEIVNEVKRVVAEEHYTLEDFIAEGKDDTLTNARLRELWLIYQDWVI
ncbi:MAG: hypothetical protein OXI96_07875 [Acidimicrobiaceae bacterium]|nr:hypothetical protein [Acidimicrobiaceae bacterium]